MVFKTHNLRVLTCQLELSFLFHLLKVDSPAYGVAEELLSALLECKEQTPLPLGTATAYKLGYHERFSRACGAGYKDNGVPEKTSTTHGIQLFISRGNA